MTIAIFADLHGRVLQAFQMVARWEKETGRKVDLILQCGDVGIYPDLERLDRPTRKRAEYDRTEIGWHDYFVKPNPIAEEILSKTDADMICVRGNHEDQAFLDGLEAAAEGPLYPVDCYGRVKMLKTGAPFCFEKDGSQLNILGVGRLGHPTGLRKWDNEIYLQKSEQDRLSRLGNIQIDVLLTHDVPQDALRLGFGSEEIRRILNKYRPSFHFHGHAGGFYFTEDENFYTWRGRLNDFAWDNPKQNSMIAEDSLGILDWKDPIEHDFEVVEAPWMKEYCAHTWKYLVS